MYANVKNPNVTLIHFSLTIVQLTFSVAVEIRCILFVDESVFLKIFSQKPFLSGISMRDRPSHKLDYLKEP